MRYWPLSVIMSYWCGLNLLKLFIAGGGKKETRGGSTNEAETVRGGKTKGIPRLAIYEAGRWFKTIDILS